MDAEKEIYQFKTRMNVACFHIPIVVWWNTQYMYHF